MNLPLFLFETHKCYLSIILILCVITLYREILFLIIYMEYIVH